MWTQILKGFKLIIDDWYHDNPHESQRYKDLLIDSPKREGSIWCRIDC